MKWYVINTLSGQEKRVEEQIMENLRKAGCQDKVEEILVPSETVSRITKGRKVVTERKFFPGYMFIKGELTDEVWGAIKSVQKVGGILGGFEKPVPVPQHEIDQIKKQIESGAALAESIESSFSVSESVKIIDGAFKGFMGTVEDVDTDRRTLKVSVIVFGRSTPVELGYHQVQKV